MGDLKELSLSDNVISEIPQDLSVFYLLESINLSGNKLTSEHKASEFFFSMASI